MIIQGAEKDVFFLTFYYFSGHNQFLKPGRNTLRTEDNDLVLRILTGSFSFCHF